MTEYTESTDFFTESDLSSSIMTQPDELNTYTETSLGQVIENLVAESGEQDLEQEEAQEEKILEKVREEQVQEDQPENTIQESIVIVDQEDAEEEAPEEAKVSDERKLPSLHIEPVEEEDTTEHDDPTPCDKKGITFSLGSSFDDDTVIVNEESKVGGYCPLFKHQSVVQEKCQTCWYDEQVHRLAKNRLIRLGMGAVALGAISALLKRQ